MATDKWYLISLREEQQQLLLLRMNIGVQQAPVETSFLLVSNTKAHAQRKILLYEALGIRSVLPSTLQRSKSLNTSSKDPGKYPEKPTDHQDESDNLAAAVAGKYRIFRDEDSTVILDIEEERRLKALGYTNAHDTKHIQDPYSGLNLTHGVHGVFDIEELVEVLRRDKAQDIFVAKLPSELKYVDFIVVVTGKSQRHMLAMAEFVRKAFKRKMDTTDIIPRIEGENSRDWIALDLGNIALHIFSKQARNVYDLDSLWSVGCDHDDLCNTPEDPLIALLHKHSVYLGDLQPNETNG